MRAISFYHNNIPAEIVQAQKAVFDHFGLPLEQIQTELSHGEAIDKWLAENEWNEIALFDVDCIPLHSEVLLNAYKKINEGFLYGGIQKANHIENSEIYIAPAFCCFTRQIWERTNKITFKDTQWHDVGSFFSAEANRNGILLWPLLPTDVEIPKWFFSDKHKFGIGTTWGNEVYHAFEIRYNKDSQRRFLNKCKEVINGN